MDPSIAAAKDAMRAAMMKYRQGAAGAPADAKAVEGRAVAAGAKDAVAARGSAVGAKNSLAARGRKLATKVRGLGKRDSLVTDLASRRIETRNQQL